MRKRYISSLVYLFLFFNTCILFLSIKSPEGKPVYNFSKDIYHSSKDMDSLYFMESIIEYGDSFVIGIHYPVFNKDKIDYLIKDLIFNKISDFRLSVKEEPLTDINYKSELNIDYEVLRGPKDIVSINFQILENAPYYAHPKTEVITVVVDLKKDKQILLRDIFKDKYLDKISVLAKDYFKNTEKYKGYTNTEVFEQGISPTHENYSSFLLEEDKIIIIFQKYQLFPGYFGIQAIEIPFTLLDNYLKDYYRNIDSLETYSSIEILESEKKLSNENDEDLIEETPNEDESPSENTRKIDPNKPMIALTFDDGPYVRATVPILNTLKEYDCVATFFVLGNRVNNYKNIISRISNEGHEIGNHSYNHKQLTTLSSKELKDQIQRTQRAVLEVIGSEPKVLRPTYGSYNKDLRKSIDMPIILWSIDPQDWKIRDPKKINNHILSNVRDGDIILMHDIFESTADAIETLVPDLLNRGFQLVTISELYELRGEALEVGNIYSHSRHK